MTIPSLNLQQRVSCTLLAFAIFVALIMGAVGYIANERIEEQIWEQTLSNELEFYLDRKRQDPELAGGTKTLLHIYEVYANARTSHQVELPPALLAFTEGVHDEIRIGERQYAILVRDIGSTRYYVTYDITELEDDEFILLIAGSSVILVTTSLLFFLSIRLSRWLLTPLYRLADDVAELNPSESNLELAGAYQDQEVKVIAVAIDRFLARLRQFIAREQEFLTTASHELRTPIAVISGACDVLQLHSELPTQLQKPVSRIARSAAEMKEIVTALMYLAKEEIVVPSSGRGEYVPEEFTEQCEVHTILKKIVDDHRYLLDDKPITVEIRELDPTTISIPESMVTIAVSNLVRNAFQHTLEGTVIISLSQGKITIEDTGPGMPHSLLSVSLTENSERTTKQRKGFGLYIIRKIAERFSWNLAFTTSDRGTCASIDFVHFQSEG